MAATQSRKYLITINNPLEKGYPHEKIKEILFAAKVDYYCFSDEIGANGTYHIHIFLYRKSPIRFDTLLKKFPGAHIDSCLGSCAENRDYVSKSGKWEEDKKAKTSVPGSFEEWGCIPTERNENHPASAELIASLESGKTTSDIIRDNPAFIFRSNDIGILRQTLLADKYMAVERELDVTYVYGPSGIGKTRSIFDRFPSSDICRVTDYNGSNGVRFDSYHGQNVLVFEEFHAEIPITSMLNYLDRYPLYLPARYSDRVACYEVVYITSNLPLDKLYRSIQLESPATWNAFLRRINRVLEYCPDGTIVEHNVGAYKLKEG